ncbi:MAG: hypothetical protein KDJ90_17895, partial [Nitratireductor sp.]|nr:hypothetical protein [Nitratireductor sp.]
MQIQRRRWAERPRARTIVLQPKCAGQAAQRKDSAPVAPNAPPTHLPTFFGEEGTAGDDGPALEITPDDRARRARKAIRKQFRTADLAARDKGRLGRKDQYALLERAYRIVRRWKRAGHAGRVKAALRRQGRVVTNRTSSLYLVLFRSAMPTLDPKRASKWAAALELAERESVQPQQIT